MPARFRIKRQRPYNAADAYPWKLKDAMRPAFLGSYPSLERALDAIDARLSQETGIPRRAEIMAWMIERQRREPEGFSQPASWHEYRDHAREFGIEA